MTRTFTLPAFSELERIREWLGLSPETVKEYVPHIDETDTSPYRDAVRNMYALFLCRKLADNLAGRSTAQAVVLPQPAPSLNVPSISELADLRVKLRLRIDEASLMMHMSASVLSRWERGDKVPTLDERKTYWNILQNCQSGKVSYTRALRRKYRRKRAGGQLTFNPLTEGEYINA